MDRKDKVKGGADRQAAAGPLDQTNGASGKPAKEGTLDVLQRMALASSRPGGPAALRLPPLRLR